MTAIRIIGGSCKAAIKLLKFFLMKLMSRPLRVNKGETSFPDVGGYSLTCVGICVLTAGAK